MPPDVSDRIAAAIAQEARLRVDPGPLARRSDAPVAASAATFGAASSTMPATSGADPDSFGGTVTTFPARNRRPRPLQLAAAVAAAAAVVAIGASALHLTQRPNGAAVVGGGISSTIQTNRPPTGTPSVPATTGGEGAGTPHIQLSTTAYDSSNLASRARNLIDHPGAPVQDLAAEAPHLGPIATPIGLQSCLAALGVTDPAAVSADLATFEGRPAAIVVVTRGGTTTAWAVERSCAPGQPGILQGATQVP
jgi:hypothetical protein